MSTAALRHLSEGQVVDGVSATREQAAALNATRLVTLTPTETGWRATAGYLVGAVTCGEIEVRVAPKIGPTSVLQLLARAHGVRGLKVDTSRLGLSPDPPLSTVLAVLFESEARDVLARGVRRGYRSEDQSLPVVRGRIRLIDQALRRFDALTPIEVTVDEWTLDTDENRRLRAATRVLLNLPGLAAATRSGLRRVDQALAGVHVPPRGSQLPDWTPTRLNSHLQQLLHLADLALDGLSVEHRIGDVVAHGFTINMAWLFENLVARILGEHYHRNGPGRLAGQQTHRLDSGARLTIKPDLLIHEGRSVLAVADTKYKLLDDKGQFPNADAYQLITYATRLGLTDGHLIYAGTPGGLPDRYDVIGPGVRLHVHAVDLTAALPDVERQITALTEHLTPQRQQYPARSA